MKIIDIRSDTVTQPDLAMRKSMAQAEVGDDVYGDDPTVNKLQQLGAEMSGKAAALFVPSGTQSNLIALLTHCQRGEEYIVGQGAHTYQYEGGGAAVLGSIQPQPLIFETDGSLDLDKVESLIKPRDVHFAQTRLLCLENTQDGKVLPMDYLEAAGKFVLEKELAFHLDGARACNAAVALNVSLETICRPFDSISICLSKGLGAPVGSLLCGGEEFIKRAKRWRKMLGGGMRQAGILAQAGIIALTENMQDLAKDHQRAEKVASALQQLAGIGVVGEQAQTNMVFLQLTPALAVGICEYLKNHQIRINPPTKGEIRLVFHRDINDEDVQKFIQVVTDYVSEFG